MGFPASGYGVQSKYFDENLLFDGSYQIISVTVHSTSRDETNTKGSAILRPGLLLVKDPVHSGYYMPLDTAANQLNGNTPTQFMSDLVVLARKIYIDKDFILGMKRERTITPTHRVAPAYFSCNLKQEMIYYNNSASVAITDEQWEECQRISVISSGMKVFEETESNVRALLWRREETFVSPSDLI